VHDFKKEVLSSVAEEEDPMVEMLLNKEARKRKEELDYKQLENQIKMALRNFNKRDAEVADKMANANVSYRVVLVCFESMDYAWLPFNYVRAAIASIAVLVSLLCISAKDVEIET